MKIIFTLTAFLILYTSALQAQNINGRFSSSVYTFERFDTADVSNTYIRSFQMLALNINQDNYSLRTSLNFENDLSKEIKDDPRLRFYNLYFEARNLFVVATIKLGRQPIFNSVVGGLFDGVHLDLRRWDVKLTAFYGGNVPAYQKLELIGDWEENNILGGKISTTALQDFQFGVGYVKKNFKPQEYWASRLDADLNPIQVLVRNNSTQFEFITGDVSYYLERIFSADVRYDYDINFEKTSRVEFNGRYEQIEDLGINIYYNYREPRIRYNSIFSVFDYGNTQEIEIGADYRIDKNFTAIGRFGNVSYRDDETSQRITAGLATRWGTVNYRKNLGYAGELDAVSLYSAYSFLEGLLTPSIGIAFTNYKLAKDSEKNNLTTLLAGVNVRPYRFLSFDLQGQYMDNKIYKNDFRLFFKVNYWFNTNLNLM